ncbi:hypothetical protein [Kitasatospora paranensis]|uniref:hypothetical protein n=1 Tax=Kitasatospora paranensis TaxID=258053 RepID=UPI0031F122D5
MHGVDESGSGPARPATTGLPSPASAGIPGRPAPGGRERAPAAPGGVLHPDTLRLWAHAVDLADWDWVVHLGARDGTLLTAVDLPPHAAVVAAAPDGSALPGLWHDLVPTVPQARVLSLTPGDRAPAAPPVLDGLGLHPEHALLARVDLDDRGRPSCGSPCPACGPWPGAPWSWRSNGSAPATWTGSPRTFSCPACAPTRGSSSTAPG